MQTLDRVVVPLQRCEGSGFPTVGFLTRYGIIREGGIAIVQTLFEVLLPIIRHGTIRVETGKAIPEFIKLITITGGRRRLGQDRDRFGIERACPVDISAIKFGIRVPFQLIGQFQLIGMSYFFPSRR